MIKVNVLKVSIVNFVYIWNAASRKLLVLLKWGLIHGQTVIYSATLMAPFCYKFSDVRANS